MAKLRKIRTRAAYQSSLWQYYKRREVLRRSFHKGTAEYRERVEKLNVKIAQWRKQIQKIDDRTEKIKTILIAVKNFTGYSLQIRGYKVKERAIKFTAGCFGGKVEERMRLARLALCIYAKYGLEQKICGKFLAEAVNRPRRTITDARLIFTRSFPSHPENQQKYQQFIEYIRNGDDNY